MKSGRASSVAIKLNKMIELTSAIDKYVANFQWIRALCEAGTDINSQADKKLRSTPFILKCTRKKLDIIYISSRDVEQTSIDVILRMKTVCNACGWWSCCRRTGLCTSFVDVDDGVVADATFVILSIIIVRC